MADCYTAKKDYERAEEFLLKALAISPEQQKAGIHLKLAKLYVQMERFDLAIEAAEDAVEARDKFYDAYFLLGSLYAMEDRNEDARHAFEQALGGAAGTNAKVYLHLASLAERESDEKRALTLYQKVLEYAPEDASAHLNIATIFARNEDLEKARLHYEKVIESGELRYMHLAYFNLGRIALEQQKWDDALHYLERAHNLRRDYVPVLFALGNLYIDVGREEEGGKLLKEMLRIDPDHPQSSIAAERLRNIETKDNVH
jgi:tetratricopeptide (TPR) repeat protein